MIAAIAALLGCQLLGEVLVRALALPLPGPVAGMGLLFLALAVRGRGRPEAERIPAAISVVGDGLLRNLSLLFVPAAVGIVQYLGLLRQYGGTIVVAVAVSTALALLATVSTFRLVARWQTRRRRRATAGRRAP